MSEWIILEIAAVWVLTWGLIPVVLAQKTKTPVATLAWVWAILLLPVLGGVFFLLFGTERIQRKRLRMVAALKERVEVSPCERANEGLGLDLKVELPELHRINGLEATQGNEVILLPDGAAFFPKLLEVIAQAERRIHLEFYIWNTDETGRIVRDALTEAARRGVEVRLLLDEIGSFWTMRRFFKDLLAAGGKVAWFGTFAPFKGSFHLNLRNHAKLVVADGVVALTGGMNIGDEYWKGAGKELPYRDLQMAVRGEAVTQLMQRFAQEWYFATGEILTQRDHYPPQARAGKISVQVVAGGPDNDLNEVQLSILSLLHRAKQRVWMMTPYFVPEAPLLTALQLAALRGVDVRLLVPSKGDHAYLTAVTRSYYDELMPHGVRIYEYRPRMLHAKVTTIDGTFAMAGSANLDIRSLRINFELNLLLAGPVVIEQFDAMFERDFALADRIRWAKFQSRPLRQKIAEAVCRPLAPML
jgi:cardiolipin synthase A/B